jgi:hypothetical protein
MELIKSGRDTLEMSGAGSTLFDAVALSPLFLVSRLSRRARETLLQLPRLPGFSSLKSSAVVSVTDGTCALPTSSILR